MTYFRKDNTGDVDEQLSLTFATSQEGLVVDKNPAGNDSNEEVRLPRNVEPLNISIC